MMLYKQQSHKECCSCSTAPLWQKQQTRCCLGGLVWIHLSLLTLLPKTFPSFDPQLVMCNNSVAKQVSRALSLYSHTCDALSLCHLSEKTKGPHIARHARQLRLQLQPDLQQLCGCCDGRLHEPSKCSCSVALYSCSEKVPLVVCTQRQCY